MSTITPNQLAAYHRDQFKFAGSLSGYLNISAPGMREAILDGIEEDAIKIVFEGVALPRPGEVVRLVTTDGWIYPFHVRDSRVNDNVASIFVVEPLAFEFDRTQRNLKLRSFPQREHQGTFRLQWIDSVHSK